MGAGGRAFKSPRLDQNILEHDREQAQEQLAQFRLSLFPCSRAIHSEKCPGRTFGEGQGAVK